MRSQIRFFMHPLDLARFVEAMRNDDQLQRLLDLTPFSSFSGKSVDLRASSDPHGNFIQFQPSELFDRVLTEGRIALATSGFGLEQKIPAPARDQLEGAFKRMRTSVKKNLVNRVVSWCNPHLPASANNPLPPDPAVWVAPAALSWWREDPSHALKQFVSDFVEAARNDSGGHA